MEKNSLGNKSRKIIQKLGKSHPLAFFCIAIAVALCALLPRLDSFDFFYGKYLWAEDGNIFLNQARDLSISAIFKPYAGYLHVYPRLITNISLLFDVLYQPTVLLLGWFVAYSILVHSLFRCLLQENISFVFLISLVILVGVQPNNGEVFFNITNSQWLLGAALCLYTLADTDICKFPWISNVFLLVLTLSGPFSVILLPILLLKLIIKRDWRDFKSTYLIVFLGAFIQLVFLLSSDRVSSGSINTNPKDWIVAFIKIVNFGANNNWTELAALGIWSSIIFLILSRQNRSRNSDSILQKVFMLLTGALLFIVAALFSQKHNPGAITGSGNRYTWIPYSLTLTSVILLSSTRRVLGGIVILLLASVFYYNFQKVTSPDLQFEAFSKFSQIESVTIPIHPQWPTFPGWHIAGKPSLALSSPAPLEIELVKKNILSSGLKINFSDGKLEMMAYDSNPYLFLNNKITCTKYSYAGVNIYLRRDDEGWMQIFWSASKSFNELDSLRRWYPSGDIKAQFAFPLDTGDTYIRIDPIEKIGFAAIKKIELYCLR